MFRRAVEYFLPPGLSDTHPRFRRTRLVAYAIAVTFLFSLFYILICIPISYYVGMAILAVSEVLYLVLLWLLRRGVSVYLVANIYGVVGVGAVYGCIYFSGGFHSPNLSWLASSPIVLLLISGKKSGYFWAAMAVAVVYAMGIAAMRGFQFPEYYNTQYRNLLEISAQSGLVLIIFFIALVFENVRLRAFEQIRREKDRSDELLLNILPAEVMEELKYTGRTTARSFDMVTVMFVDFKNFTQLSEKQSPEELVSGIDEYFEAFDRIIEEHRVEKIKTVGDAYLCAAGLPVPHERHAEQMVDTAMAMLKSVELLRERRTREGKVHYDVRIGIHSGAVVAGVVGIKKFAYDIWGDTVNTAARIQQSSQAHQINISGSTEALVRDRYRCVHRGRIPAKHKGEIDMYFVEGRI